MRCELETYVKDGDTLIDFHVDRRLFDDDPIWDAIERVEGVSHAYKPRDIKRLLTVFAHAHGLPDDPLLDNGTYRSQVCVARMFKPDDVMRNLTAFFATWTDGQHLTVEVN